MVVSRLASIPLSNENCSAYAGAAPSSAMASASGFAAGRKADLMGRFSSMVSLFLFPRFLRSGAIVHSMQRLEKARGAHAGADAHRHHPVLAAGAAHAVHEG